MPSMRCVLAAVVFGLLGGCATAERPPNVVLIVSDDAGYADVFAGGVSGVATPHLDRLASEGTRFGSGYVTASVCSPSRAGLLSGRYQQRFGHEFNLGGEAERAGSGMPGEVVTIAEMLGGAGYATGLVGKWHVGQGEGQDPLSQGFDEFDGILHGSRSYFRRDPDDRRVLYDGQEVIAEPGDLYLTDWMGDRSVEFIDRHAGSPFFLMASFTAPHTPMEATEADLASVGAELAAGTEERRRVYAAMMRSLDRNVGRILDEIDGRGLREDTIVFFVNDNGGATNNGSDNGALRGMKGSKWEGGVRVPFAVRWPGVAEAGGVFDGPVSSLDIAATAASAAGLDTDSLGLDGVDLRPLLAGERGANAGRALYWRRGVAAAVRSGKWKLIRSEGNPTLLFDLEADPSETRDLAAERPEVVSRLLAALEAWEAGLGEPGWEEGARWERNQRLKHRMDVIGREAERRYP
jgi:arylsulfatase A-like enzyme